MVYLAAYNNKGIIDIEWYLTYNEDNHDLWKSEVKVTVIPDGLVEYCYDTKTKFVLTELVNDINNLRNLKFQLYEYWGNKSIPIDDARKRHNEYSTLIDTNIKAFCKKYNFELDID